MMNLLVNSVLCHKSYR